MFFDDRLATVLRHRAASEVGARTQFRQLLDILGNRKFVTEGERESALVAAAWLRMEALAELIPAGDRARMIRESGWRFRNADLAIHLADHEPEVASAALIRAQLSSDDWAALIPRLPVRARGFLRLRRDLPVDVEELLDRLGVSDRGLPAPVCGEELHDAAALTSATPEVFAESPPVVDDPSEPFELTDEIEGGRSEISALVERIAQFRRSRDQGDGDAERSPPLPLGLPLDEAGPHSARKLRNFGFVADASGRIEWADGEVAAMVIGTRLTRPRTLGEADTANAVERAFARRLPIETARFALDGAPAIAGDWVVDARPRFTDEGNFADYLGRFRRPWGSDDDAGSPAAREADRIRQLLHELRTPVTAIQGYAEVIQQQLFGPAPHEYRALAAAIAADAARILAGFEELDRLAKLETGALAIEPGATDLTQLTRATVAQLAQVLGARMAGIDLEKTDADPVMIAIDSGDAEALAWRLLATLGGNCASGETLDARIESGGGRARLMCELPAKLMEEEDIFAAEARPIGSAVNAGLFGAGFALRLARAEARTAGGDLEVDEDMVTLVLPLLTGAEALPSPATSAHGGDPA